MIQKVNTKMMVQLSSQVDPFRYGQLSSSEQILETRKPNESIFFEVKSFKEAAELCRKFIKQYNLGGSNWTGGLIVDENFNFLATVSYNGRVWDSEDWRNAKEIEIC